MTCKENEIHKSLLHYNVFENNFSLVCMVHMTGVNFLADHSGEMVTTNIKAKKGRFERSLEDPTRKL